MNNNYNDDVDEKITDKKIYFILSWTHVLVINFFFVVAAGGNTRYFFGEFLKFLLKSSIIQNS